jgi:hypothetical protein
MALAGQKKELSEDLTGPGAEILAALSDLPGFELAADEERFPPVVLETSFKAFAPANIGVYLERFQKVAEEISTVRPNEARTAIEEEIGWAEQLERGFSLELRPRSLRKYRAGLSVLVDLISQNWVYRFRDHQLELAPPDFTEAPKSHEDIARQKRAIRLAMRSERLAQLQPESVRRFIAEMEDARSRNGKASCSVLDLVADGEAMAGEIERAQRLETDYEAALARLFQPYLQLAKDDDRCSETGMRLIDIWRYFRYYWSLPYFSTPGRNLFYLVRDRARPLHPVIGIAALGNSIVHLSDREKRIGWSVDALQSRVSAVSDAVTRKELLEDLYSHHMAVLEGEIDAIDPSGLVSRGELKKPSFDLVHRLLSVARDSGYRRRELLKGHESAARSAIKPARLRPVDPSKIRSMPEAVRTLADRSVEELFKQKRATQLAELLRAKLIFDAAARKDGDAAAAMNTLLQEEEGRRALSTAIRAIKQQHIGSSMMDIIICGAIPPYADLLGGKLVCMLLTSPEVRMDYRDRYENAPSEIASKMRGEDHARSAELVYLGTTSLYHVGSSQYNRVKIPADLRSGVGEVRYERLGETRGYGSVHFSDRTRTLMEEIMRDENGATFITRTFGEGVNPKLRLVREGLAAVGIDQDHFLRHQCRRIIYGVSLARNTNEYLRNEEGKPRYVLEASSRKEARAWTSTISQHWMRRWLAPRSRNADILRRVLAASKGEVQISKAVLSDSAGSVVTNYEDAAARHGGGRTPPPSAGEIGVRFVQQLYNHRSCYADRLTDKQLEAIHVETPLEEFILETLKAGKDIVLTGNPGDGKTHLIKKLMPQLSTLGVESHADASAEESYEKILEYWKAAKRRKKSFCLAINEWPLLEFVQQCGEGFQPLQEVRKQIERGVIYADDVPGPVSVVVLDLNNRNLATKEVFRKLLSTLTDSRFYPECSSCPAQQTCDVPRARTILDQERVKDRIYQVLELVTKRGFHVTMRDLQGFIAYLITGGRSCEQLISPENERSPRPYSDLAFDGQSELFDAIREVFDPAKVTHPIYDDALWSGDLGPTGWTKLGPPAPPPSKAPNPENVLVAMRTAKRRFFFEHEDGADLLKLLPPDERLFYETLDRANADAERIVRELIRLINRFFDTSDEEDTALRLWNRHRYDARWSPTYVSVQSISNEAFSLETPRLPRATTKAFEYQPNHVVLAAYRKSGEQAVARLTVDLALYRTLYDARRGLPMALRSAEVLKRLDKFFNELGRAFRKEQDIEEVHIKNFETGQNLRFRVDRKHKRYSV